jgi:ABC-type multidrug transport system fused ATPase/permease subunit
MATMSKNMIRPIFANILRFFSKRNVCPHDDEIHSLAMLNGFSIRENVGIGQVDRIEDENALLSVLSTCGLEEFIRELPKRLDTKVGRPIDDELSRAHRSLGLTKSTSAMPYDDEFILLSGGQLQKLALARAFMRISEAGLLILDEPSSNLDPEAEFALFKNIKKFRQGKTTIFITHRYNTVRIADRIMVLEHGSIRECGTHEELMQIPNGRYQFLYTLQTGGFGDHT